MIDPLYRPRLRVPYDSHHLVCIGCGNFSPPCVGPMVVFEIAEMLVRTGWSFDAGAARCGKCQEDARADEGRVHREVRLMTCSHEPPRAGCIDCDLKSGALAKRPPSPSFLNGWNQLGYWGETVLIGCLVLCIGCGRDKGMTSVALSEDWEPPPDPDFPFSGDNCPVCRLQANEEVGDHG